MERHSVKLDRPGAARLRGTWVTEMHSAVGMKVTFVLLHSRKLSLALRSVTWIDIRLSVCPNIVSSLFQIVVSLFSSLILTI